LYRRSAFDNRAADLIDGSVTSPRDHEPDTGGHGGLSELARMACALGQSDFGSNAQPLERAGGHVQSIARAAPSRRSGDGIDDDESGDSQQIIRSPVVPTFPPSQGFGEVSPKFAGNLRTAADSRTVRP
jgi:hypothetical protein